MKVYEDLLINKTIKIRVMHSLIQLSINYALTKQQCKIIQYNNILSYYKKQKYKISQQQLKLMIEDTNNSTNPSLNTTNTNNNANLGSMQLNQQTTLHYLKSAPNPYDLDIIPGVYEGGYKIWQCTIDLLKYLSQYTKQQYWHDKTVIDIGCGCGLVGIAALKLGANLCYFQDYNQEVLESITKPNSHYNNVNSSQCAYIAGDWESLQIPTKFDVILGSQIIYKEQNYSKIVNLCKKYLKQQTGIAIFANKCYYFGVGGNMDDFRDAVEQRGLYCNTLKKIEPNKGGNKKEIVQIGWSQGMQSHEGIDSEGQSEMKEE